MPWTRDELDAAVKQRLESASRCASAISHDLGNIVLIGEVIESADAPSEANGNFGPPMSLMQHFRQLLSTLEIWRHLDREESQPIDIPAWWQAHGGLLRQFVRRGASVTLAREVPREPKVDCIVITRLTAAILCAVDLQIPSLERLVLRTSDAEDGSRVRIDFVPTPKSSAHGLVIPSIVTSRINASPGRADLTIDEGDALFVLRLDAVVREAT